MTTALTDRSKQAFSLAFDLHKDQKRKIAPGESEDLAVPYITHLMNVASYVLQAGGNEDQFIAALLHDSIEDQPNTLGKPTVEIIKEQFGERVLELVLACTDGEPNQVRDASIWRDRKEKYLQDQWILADYWHESHEPAVLRRFLSFLCLYRHSCKAEKGSHKPW